MGKKLMVILASVALFATCVGAQEEDKDVQCPGCKMSITKRQPFLQPEEDYDDFAGDPDDATWDAENEEWNIEGWSVNPGSKTPQSTLIATLKIDVNKRTDGVCIIDGQYCREKSQCGFEMKATYKFFATKSAWSNKWTIKVNGQLPITQSAWHSKPNKDSISVHLKDFRQCQGTTHGGLYRRAYMVITNGLNSKDNGIKFICQSCTNS